MTLSEKAILTLPIEPVEANLQKSIDGKLLIRSRVALAFTSSLGRSQTIFPFDATI